MHLLHHQLLAPVPNGDLSSTWTSPSLNFLFLSFISKAKQDQALPSHVRGKFWLFELQQCSVCNFLGHPVHIAWFQNKFGLLTLNGNKVDVGDVGEKMRSWLAKCPII